MGIKRTCSLCISDEMVKIGGKPCKFVSLFELAAILFAKNGESICTVIVVLYTQSGRNSVRNMAQISNENAC